MSQLAAKKPRQLSVGLVADDDLGTAVEEAELAVRKLAGRRGASAARDQLEQAQVALDAATIWFTFQSLGVRAFEALVAEHPPTAEQIAAAAEAGAPRPDWNDQTFGGALIAASCISPRITPEQAHELLGDPAWNVAEVGALVATALTVNTRARPLQVRES